MCVLPQFMSREQTMAKNAQLLKLLVIVGCILAIIGAIMSFVSGKAWPIIAGIIIIVLAVLLLAGEGVIPKLTVKLPTTWIVVLIVGIVFIAIGDYLWALIGGILLIVSALLDNFT